MFKVDLSKTDFTTKEVFEGTVKLAEEEIEAMVKELEEYKAKGEERLKQLDEWIDNKEIKFTGEIRKVGNGIKELKIIIIFPDETQRIYSLSSNKVEELRDMVNKMKYFYSDYDWSAFDYKLR